MDAKGRCEVVTSIVLYIYIFINVWHLVVVHEDHMVV